MDLREAEFDTVDSIHPVHDRNLWQALVNTE
jgi:hypothetical protein